MRTRIKQLKADSIGKKIMTCGWVRSVRTQKACAFIALNDGSTISHLQLVASPEQTNNYEQILGQLTIGTSVQVEGTLVASKGQEQPWELQAQTITTLGPCDDTYPLQKKYHSLEFLRELGHLRPRTNTLGAVARVRNALSYATHQFFQQQGFLYVHTPIITASDCEGAGQMFRVTTLPAGKQDAAQDFFGKQAYLTVSGQLNGEAYACALSDIYTFGPTFRAENSNTARHLAEFWMIEPEMAFADLNDNMTCAQNYLQHVISYVLQECAADLAFFEKQYQPGLVERLKLIASTPFARISYTEAIEILLSCNKEFQFPVSWGCDLQSEHERYLAQEHVGGPVIVYNYPKQIKSFYMRLNEDGKTVAAMDVLCPGVGEIIGGSQREERLDVLRARMQECGLHEADYSWYLDLRRYGSVPHAGFGLGLERLVLFVTGMENIRDVIPFPRYPKHCDF